MGYEWLKNSNSLANGGNVVGPTSNALTLANVSLADLGYYQVVVTNLYGSVTSRAAALAMNNLPFALLATPGSRGSNSGPFAFNLSGPVGSNVVIFASTNLHNWIPLATNPLTLGTLIFMDKQSTNYPRRFYRATMQP